RQDVIKLSTRILPTTSAYDENTSQTMKSNLSKKDECYALFAACCKRFPLSSLIFSANIDEFLVEPLTMNRALL
uniref:Uncharacterized protein n=1 Tax=Parascaris univalens TaxID=6257 RepID=A0A915C3T3_PARUN